MPTTISQIPIRCRLSTVSNPPAYPIDDNTGEAPAFWRGQDVTIQIGVFNSMNMPVDLGNITDLQLIIRDASTSAFAYVSTVTNQIIPVISYSSWAAGTAQQAEFDLTAAMTDLPLDGQESAQLWMSITGFTSTGQQLVYGAGPITVYNPGAYITPISTEAVNEQAVTNSSGDTDITLPAQVNTVLVAVTGTARTSNINVKRLNMTNGRNVRLVFALPSVAGIILDIRDNTSTGTLLAEIQTDGEQLSAVVDLVYTGSVWTMTSAAIPAF